MFCGRFFIGVSKLKLSLSEFSLFEFSLSEFDFICELSLAIFLLESLVKSHVLYSIVRIDNYMFMNCHGISGYEFFRL